MQALQKEKLGKRCEDLGADLTWCDKFEDVLPCAYLCYFFVHVNS
jgi:hypothetical protein